MEWENKDHLVQAAADSKGHKETVEKNEMWVLMNSSFCIPGVIYGWLLCAQGRGARYLWLRWNPFSANSSLHTSGWILYSQNYMESGSESTCRLPHPDWSFQRALWGLQLHIVTLVYALLWQKNQKSIQIQNLIISNYCISGNCCIFRCSRNPQSLQGKNTVWDTKFWKGSGVFPAITMVRTQPQAYSKATKPNQDWDPDSLML